MDMKIRSRTRDSRKNKLDARSLYLHRAFLRHSDYARAIAYSGQQEKSGRKGSRYADALWWMEPAMVIPIESGLSLSLFLFAHARVTLTHFVHVKAESSSRCLSLYRLSRVFVFSKPLRLYHGGYTRRTSARRTPETCDKTVSEIQRGDLHLGLMGAIFISWVRTGERVREKQEKRSNRPLRSLFRMNDAWKDVSCARLTYTLIFANKIEMCLNEDDFNTR